MRVGIVCPYDWSYPGGVRSHILGLSAALPDVSGGRAEAVILAPSSDGEPGIWSAGRTVGIPANGSVARLCFGPGPARRVADRLAEGDLDVLHLHEPAIPSISLLALKEARVPVVATFHAAAASSFGYAAARPVLSRLLAKVDVRIAVSEAARALVGAYFPAPYRLIPNGVPVQRFRGAAPDAALLARKPFVLFVGRPEPRKGFDVLLRAMDDVRRVVDARLVTTSAPPSAPDWVIPLGRVPDDRLPGVYAAADVFCAPSVEGESFGIVLVEAMAAGTAVVSSDLEGYRLAAGDAARRAPVGDAAGLAKELLCVLGDAGERRRLVAAGERRAAELDWHVVGRAVLACYEEAVGW